MDGISGQDHIGKRDKKPIPAQLPFTLQVLAATSLEAILIVTALETQ